MLKVEHDAVGGRVAGAGPVLAGIELGGTKCVATLAGGPDRIVAMQTVATTTPAETLGQLAEVLDAWCARHDVAALGIASFGPLGLRPDTADHGRMLETNKPGWQDADILGRLAGGRALPVAFDTDVNGAAIAESRWGAGRGLADFAYVTVGTGVGVGLIVHGRPTRGLAHNEMGHLRVPRLPGDRAPSGCRFHDDCVEGLAAGVGILAAAGGRPLETIPADDPLWDRVVAALGALGHALAVTTGPHRIALGGGVIAHQPHLRARVEAAVRASINGYFRLPATAYVVAPELGDRAGPLGPIAMALQLLEKERVA